MSDRVFGWRRVGAVLASSQNARLLAPFGIDAPEAGVRHWARRLLDDVDDFYEVYDVDPDEGAAAETLEAQLAALVPGATLGALREGAMLFTRTDEGDLDDWTKVFLALRWQDKLRWPSPKARLRADLRTVVISLVDACEINGPWQVDDPDSDEDEWVVGFAGRHGVWPIEIASYWAALAQTGAAVREVYEALSPADREELETWGQIQQYSGRRPPAPPAPILRLGNAVRRGWADVPIADAD